MPGVAEQRIFTLIHVFSYISFICIHIFISFIYFHSMLIVILNCLVAGGSCPGQCRASQARVMPRGITVALRVADCASCSCYKHHGFSQVAFEWCQWPGTEKLASRTHKRANEAPFCRNCDALWASTCEETRHRAGSPLGDQS